MEIKPCPFCGDIDEESTVYLHEEDGTLWVECAECLASGPIHFDEDSTSEDCIREWNTFYEYVVAGKEVCGG